MHYSEFFEMKYRNEEEKLKAFKTCFNLLFSGGNMGYRPLGPKEIDGLFVPPGKAYTPLTGHLTTG